MPSSQVLVLGLAVRFLSLLPASLPQLFHRCLPSALTSGPFHFRLPFFRPFLFRFQLLSFLFLPFLLLPVSASQWLPRCALSALASLAFPVLSDLVSHVFLPGSLYSALLMVSFRPSLIRSRSCSSGAYLMLTLSVFPLPIRFLSSASLPVPATQPLFLPFLFLPGSASQWLPRCTPSAFAFRLSPFFPARFPVPSFPVYVLGFL